MTGIAFGNKRSHLFEDMLTNVTIRNIGKLEDAKIRIGRFTVLAGPNNSGKSFVSRTIYSIIETLDENYVERYFRRQFEPLCDRLNWIIDFSEDSPGGEQSQLVIQKLVDSMTKSQFNNPEEVSRSIATIVKQISELLAGGGRVVPVSEHLGDLLRTEYDAVVERLKDVRTI